jgi:hypothetical protein
MSPETEPNDWIKVEYLGRTAVITLNRPEKLNALPKDGFYTLSQRLREIDTHAEVTTTVLIGKGRFFSACVSKSHPFPDSKTNDYPKLTYHKNSQRSRRLHLPPNPPRHRPLAPRPPRNRRQQPQPNPSLLLALQNPRHSPQRARGRHRRRADLVLGFHLLRAAHLPPHPLLQPRPDSRRRRVGRFRAPDGHRESE